MIGLAGVGQITGGVDGSVIFGSRLEGTVMKPLVWTAEVSGPPPEAGSYA